jgi:hypothetical protein
MQSDIPKYLVETDILVDFLTSSNEDMSYLLKLMQKGICFTSVLNASELLFHTRNDFEKAKVMDLLYSIKVLGLHSRYSLSVPQYSEKFGNIRDTLFFILAKLNKLIIVSLNPKKYEGLEVQSVHPAIIE